MADYNNSIPVFEIKNKLSLYLHKAETEGPVFISNRGKTAYVIQTVEDFEKLSNTAPKETTLVEKAARLRKKYEITEDDFIYNDNNFDFSEHLEKLRDYDYNFMESKSEKEIIQEFYK